MRKVRSVLKSEAGTVLEGPQSPELGTPTDAEKPHVLGLRDSESMSLGPVPLFPPLGGCSDDTTSLDQIQPGSQSRANVPGTKELAWYLCARPPSALRCQVLGPVSLAAGPRGRTSRRGEQLQGLPPPGSLPLRLHTRPRLQADVDHLDSAVSSAGAQAESDFPARVFLSPACGVEQRSLWRLAGLAFHLQAAGPTLGRSLGPETDPAAIQHEPGARTGGTRLLPLQRGGHELGTPDPKVFPGLGERRGLPRLGEPASLLSFTVQTVAEGGGAPHQQTCQFKVGYSACLDLPRESLPLISPFSSMDSSYFKDSRCPLFSEGAIRPVTLAGPCFSPHPSRKNSLNVELFPHVLTTLGLFPQQDWRALAGEPAGAGEVGDHPPGEGVITGKERLARDPSSSSEPGRRSEFLLRLPNTVVKPFEQ
ncbi:uncharacterized protein LOC124976648 [Sciurus carolinensis]|uniref:uncharacterized protein LOC124976648 n=1 Tax=Sciurus carolinensis TaxID=30640 RepID=UPI001FB41505|nr:uncharacterized protein LOC124976648 [Sciurus carolinensis]